MEVELREPHGGGSVTAACGGGELGHLGGCVSYFKGGGNQSRKQYLLKAVVKSFTFKFLAIFLECNLDSIQVKKRNIKYHWSLCPCLLKNMSAQNFSVTLSIFALQQ